jgi:hypothetical protein
MASPVELLGDLLLVAEKRLGVPAEQLLQTASLSGLESMLIELSAGSEVGEAYPTAVEEAAICGAWVIRRQPFSKNNREIGYECMRLMLKEAEVPWPRPQEDAHQIEVKLQALEERLISEEKFVDWVCLRVAAG